VHRSVKTQHSESSIGPTLKKFPATTGGHAPVSLLGYVMH